ncbi:hypothetical protein SDC9_129872 [bioreactor metagenome]|uniref:Uncharacterized protein n=1 Tax=bioreactor metagenome TaxID=1076179 RepID=A0A645D003_9ZZZZ
MPHVQAVRRGVKADIEHGLSVVHQLPDLRLVGHLCDQAPGLQFLVNFHCLISPVFLSFEFGTGRGKNALRPMGTEGESLRGTTSVRAVLADRRLLPRPRRDRAVTGAARARLLGRILAVWAPVQRCIHPRPPTSLHRPEALFATPRGVLLPIITVLLYTSDSIPVFSVFVKKKEPPWDSGSNFHC